MYILKLIDNQIQFFHTEWNVPNYELEFFEIHFEAPCILLAKSILDILLVATI